MKHSISTESPMEEEKSESCPDIDCVNDSGETQLHVAADVGNLNKVISLLNDGANIYARNKHGSVPLHIAAKHGHLEIVKILLEKGTDINVTNKYHETPLSLAAWYNRLEIVQYLIERGAIFATENKSNFMNSLENALYMKNFEIGKILIDNGVDVNGIIPHAHFARTTNGTLLHKVARHTESDSIQFLVENGANVNATENDGRTPLCLLIKHNGTLDQIKYLLDHGADPNNKRGGSALFWCAYSWYGHCYPDIIKLLIERGADVNLGDEYGRKPLHMARCLSFIKLLVENGADVNAIKSEGQTHLHDASKLSVVKYLIQKGANVHALDSEECTPLHYANSVSIAEVLVENGANVNARNLKGYTPLHLARNVAIAQFLLEKGADINALGTNNKRTVLHTNAELDTLCYVYFKHAPDVTDFFLDMGINVNVTDIDGKTPLHVCNESSNIYVAKKLIAKGADIEALDNDNKTPADDRPGIVTHMINKTIELFSALQSRDNFVAIQKLVTPNITYDAVYGPDKMTLLHYAVQTMKLPIVKLFLNKYMQYRHRRNHFWRIVNVNARNVNGWTPLHYAAEKDDKRIVNSLLYYGATYNVKTVDGLTPREIATNDVTKELFDTLDKCFISIKEGDYDNVSRYIKNNIDIVNATDENGNTSLYWAVDKGHAKIVQLLLHNRANMTIANNEGVTVIHAAVTRGNEEILKILLDDIVVMENESNFIDCKIFSNGDTALHVAARRGSLEIVRLLLSHHAIYNEKNKEYKTPCDVSVNPDVTKLLQTIHYYFQEAEDSNTDIVEKLKTTELDDFRAIVNAWNRENLTLLKITMENYNFNFRDNLSKLVSTRISKWPNVAKIKTKETSEDDDSDIDLGFGLFD